MKKLLLALAALAISAPSQAAWVGRLDLSPSVSPIMIRELHDGQWLAGVTKENAWHLDHTGGGPLDGQRLHAGFFQAWNAEQGNPTFGLVAGIDLPSGLGHAVSTIGNAIGFDSIFKPLQYADAALSLDALGGWRPSHTPDTHAWTYGIGVRLNVAFGVSELKKGL